MLKFNTVEWWRALGEALEKDEKYLEYCKEALKPFTLKLCHNLPDDKSIVLVFENGRIIDVHDVCPEEEIDVVITTSYEVLSKTAKKELTLNYVFTHGLCKVKGLATVLIYARPLTHMWEAVAPTIPTEF